MNLLAILLLCAACFLIAYRLYGFWLSKILRLNPATQTPAVQLRDDIDYEPIHYRFLMSQHFSAIAAAGPIVGPILAATYFGWLPAILWIVLGSIFIGGVHDLTALTASIRHNAMSIAQVVRDHVTRRSYVLFLIFIWIALVYIIVAFTDLVAASFVGAKPLGDGSQIQGGAVATSSILYLLLPLTMGLLMRYARLGLNLATIIFLPLIALAVWLGPSFPLNFDSLLHTSPINAQRIWNVLLLVYCFVASVVPMWLLLQPRGHLGGFFLFIALVGGLLGAAFGNHPIQYPAFTSWSVPNTGQTLFPILFITIACGACSGFHSIIASGTTSKQLRIETDARPVGYGSMLLEGMVAVLSVCCVMTLAKDSPLLQSKPTPDVLYAQGMAKFLSVLGVPTSFAFAFIMLAFTTFVYDTLDVCTRLGRYIIQELTGLHHLPGRFIATTLTAGVPLVFLLTQPLDEQGNIIPAWRTFWALFGASNQLLAALTLLGVTVWLWRTYRKPWVWFVTGLPTVFMYVMSSWALLLFIKNGFLTPQGDFNPLPPNPVPWAALVLLSLAILVLIEALRVLFINSQPPRQGRAPAMPATA